MHSHLHLNLNPQKHTAHSCQIDCTNHDEVITSLELKSKDLYYFWRNYQWLYNKYYNEQAGQQTGQEGGKQQGQSNGAAISQLNQQIYTLEEEKQKLISQNRKLKLQLQLASKRAENPNTANTNQNSKKIEQQYQKQLNRVNIKCQQYQRIRQKQQKQILTLTQLLKTKQQSIQDLQSKYKRQHRKLQENILELQTTIDSLRAKNLGGGGTGGAGGNQIQRVLEIQEKSRREMQKMALLVRNLEEKCCELLEGQFEDLRGELLGQFPEMFARLTSGDLGWIINQEYEDEEHHH